MMNAEFRIQNVEKEETHPPVLIHSPDDGVNFLVYADYGSASGPEVPAPDPPGRSINRFEDMGLVLRVMQRRLSPATKSIA
jgi:hypothetical protein